MEYSPIDEINEFINRFQMKQQRQRCVSGIQLRIVERLVEIKSKGSITSGEYSEVRSLCEVNKELTQIARATDFDEFIMQVSLETALDMMDPLTGYWQSNPKPK